MDEAAAQGIATGILQNGFAVLGEALSLEFTSETGASADIDDASLSTLIASHPVCVDIKGASGFVTILLTLEDATRLASLSDSGEANASDALSDESISTLNQLFGPFINASLENDGVNTQAREAEAAADLISNLGEEAASVTFTFSADPHFQSTGHLLIAADVQLKSGGDDPLVSDDEMNDILSGFTPDQEGSYGGDMPENIDVIMGIDLTATARLGKIEMPIGEVLSMGPGSILEVGHLVDEPVELLINGRLIARGDVVVVDEKFGLRITEIISPKERIESLG